MAKRHPKETAFRENWESMAYPGETRAALAEELVVQNDWLERLEDPELGRVGHELHKAFVQTGCTEKVRNPADISSNAVASFTSFSYNLGSKTTYFENMIRYGMQALSSRARLFSSRVHEMIHAIQYEKSPVLHTEIGIYDSPFIICPRDDALLDKFMEQDAYAKQSWLTSLLRPAVPPDDPAIDETLAGYFDYFRQKLGGLRAAMFITSQILLDSKDEEKGIFSVGQHYCEKRLEQYQKTLPSRLDDIRAGRVTLVRLEPEDIWEVMNAFGPNMMGDERPPSAALRPPDLKPESQKLLADLNEQLGITDENELPTLNEALRARSMNRADLLKICAKPATMWQSFKHYLGLHY